MLIRDVDIADAEAIAEIYNHYISETQVTFEEVCVEGKEIAGRIEETQAQGLVWLVALDEGGSILGYCYASKWKGRCAYRFAVEITVYLHPDKIGKGAGTRLYEVLFERLKAKNFHVVIGGIALPNPASAKLHEKFGMKKIGQFEQVGFKFGEWVDVGYWQGFLNAGKE